MPRVNIGVKDIVVIYLYIRLSERQNALPHV